MKRKPTAAEKRHMSKVAALGCYACRLNGYDDTPAELHHIRTGVGKGQKASNYQVIPLCPHHHRHGSYGEAIHSGAKVWQERFGYELDIVEIINKEVGHE